MKTDNSSIRESIQLLDLEALDKYNKLIETTEEAILTKIRVRDGEENLERRRRLLHSFLFLLLVFASLSISVYHFYS